MIELKKSDQYPQMPAYFRAAKRKETQLASLDGAEYAYFRLIFNAEYQPGASITTPADAQRFPHNKFILTGVEPGDKESHLPIEEAEGLFEMMVRQDCHRCCPQASLLMSHSPRYIFEKMKESVHKHVSSLPDSLSQHQGHLKLEETVVYFSTQLGVPRAQVEKAVSLGIYEGQIVPFSKDRIQFVTALLSRAVKTSQARDR